MIDRVRFFRALGRQKDLNRVKELIRARSPAELKSWIAAAPENNLAAGTIRAAQEVDGAEAGERAVKSYLAEEKPKMEKGLTVLATLGANAPFIGLFGTVLGIIQAFGELSRNQSGMQNVMSSISEALVSTAIGLFVAIPAVVAYNVFSKQVKTHLSECEMLRDLYLSRAKS